MSKVIQVVSMKGIKYGDIDKAIFLFQAVEGACKEEGFEANGLSATCGDIYGYFTLLVGVPDGVSDKSAASIGNALANVLIGKYDVIDQPIENLNKWIMTGSGKESVEVPKPE